MGPRTPAGNIAPVGDTRIVSILTTHERGGAEYASVDLLAALQARGHDVVLVTNLSELAIGTDVPVRTLDLGPKLARRSVASVLLRAPLVLKRMVRALRSARPVGVTLVHFKKEQLLSALLPRRLSGRLVWIEWGPVPPPLRRGPARALYALAARRAHRILAVSQGTGDTIVATGVPCAKVTVMPDLVNLHSVEFDAAARAATRQAWGVAEHTLVVGCIARLQRRKRTDVLIDAMAYIDGDVLLVIAGEGEEGEPCAPAPRPSASACVSFPMCAARWRHSCQLAICSRSRPARPRPTDRA